MPLYDYTCDTCGVTAEFVTALCELDKPIICECGSVLKRVRLGRIAIHPTHTPSAIMTNGQKVPGLFGKSAPLRRRPNK